MDITAPRERLSSGGIYKEATAFAPKICLWVTTGPGAGAGIVADRRRLCVLIRCLNWRSRTAEGEGLPPIARPLALGVRSPSFTGCDSVCWRRGELGAAPLLVLWELLICRRGDEGAALAFPLAGDDSKNMGLDASCEARVLRGV